MNILVLNSGSSSLKFQVIDVKKSKVSVKGQADGIGLKTSKFIIQIGNEKNEKSIVIKNYNDAVKMIFDILKEKKLDKTIKAIGHRVVHGGEYYSKSCIITLDVIKRIKELYSLAPLHNPPNLEGILACKKVMPKLKQVAVFDTSFHQTISEDAYMYAIPYDYYKKYKIRKYGFHGTSHKYVMLEAQKLLKKKNAKIITCHLGNGSSICAIKNGKSIEISMGLTPLQGLIMGTRCGDIDPEIVSYLSEHEKIPVTDVIKILNKQSGLKGICGDSDVRTVRQKSKRSKLHRLALNMFSHRIVHYIGAYDAMLNGADALVFTAGIGQNAWYLRKQICESVSHMGFVIDSKKNLNNSLVISKPNSKVKIYVIPTNEELMIARDTAKLV